MDPYRILFPLGTLGALAGTIAWIAFGFGASTSYPGLVHPFVMISVFLFAFISGFLMTAIPQFTGAKRAGPVEIIVAALFIVALGGTSFREEPSALSWALASAAILNLALFCARRFLTRVYSPPRFFVFVGLGLLMGLAGALLQMAGASGWLEGADWIEGSPVTFGGLIYLQGMPLALIAGVGSHLLPAIWGWSDLPIQITKLDLKPPSRWKTIGPAFLYAAIFLASFVIEATLSGSGGRALRALIVTMLAIWNWQILKKPKTRGKLAFWLWIAAWFLILGLWMPVFMPEHTIDALHLMFVGGFGLMTLMIASRVTLAHGGYGYRVEVRSKLITWASILILIAAVTRFTAGFMPSLYLHHLAYAALLWITGILLWALALLPKIARLRGPSHEAES